MRAILMALAMVVSGAAIAAPGRCLLVVDGRTYLNGSCDVSISPGGSFQVQNRGQIRYFALVNPDGPGQAIGYWNQEVGATHAHTDLGTLRRNDACWSNDKAIVCAWR